MKENGSIRFDIKVPKYDYDDDVDHYHHHFYQPGVRPSINDSTDEKHDNVNHHDNDKLKTVYSHRQRISTASLSAEPPVVPLSLIAKQLYKNSYNIILAFKSLYNKYIDTNYAPFMINISSKCREELMKSLDCNYYGNKVIKPKIVKQEKSNNKVKVFDVIVNKALIDDEWLQHSKSIDWLLVKLLVQMDCAHVHCHSAIIY